MNEKLHYDPLTKRYFTEKDADYIFITSFASTDLKGMLVAQRMKHIILIDALSEKGYLDKKNFIIFKKRDGETE